MLDILEDKLAKGLIFEGNADGGVERVDLLNKLRNGARDG